MKQERNKKNDLRITFEFCSSRKSELSFQIRDNLDEGLNDKLARESRFPAKPAALMTMASQLIGKRNRFHSGESHSDGELDEYEPRRKLLKTPNIQKVNFFQGDEVPSFARLLVFGSLEKEINLSKPVSARNFPQK